VALRDALVGAALPFVEVHLSNVWRREAYRHESLLSDVARGVVVGLGPVGYELALRGLVAHLR
jgi:3-dehydroquinate dehydratase-2